MKKRVNSIKKGKKFELVVAKYLSKITDEEWLRVPQSGGMATNYNLKQFKGDVIKKAVFDGGEKQKLVIECKQQKEAIKLSDLNNPKSKLFEWIDQCKSESGNMPWMLFFKWNFSQMFVLCDPGYYPCLIDVLANSDFVCSIETESLEKYDIRVLH